MTHTKTVRYIARNDYAAIVDGIEIGFSDTAFGAEIIANDYVSAQIKLATRAADGAEGQTAMDMITFLTLKSGHQQEIVAIHEESLGQDKSDMKATKKWTQSYHQAFARYQKADTALIAELNILWDINAQIFDLLESLES